MYHNFISVTHFINRDNNKKSELLQKYISRNIFSLNGKICA